MQINENYRLVIEDDNNVVLQFFETRQKKNKETGKLTDYEYTDSYFYPSVVSALRRFLDLSQKSAKDVEDCIRITEETYKKIEKLKFK